MNEKPEINKPTKEKLAELAKEKEVGSQERKELGTVGQSTCTGDIDPIDPQWSDRR
jgi:hypothetical protein